MEQPSCVLKVEHFPFKPAFYKKKKKKPNTYLLHIATTLHFSVFCVMYDKLTVGQISFAFFLFFFLPHEGNIIVDSAQ